MSLSAPESPADRRPFTTPDAFTTRPELRGTFGMAASTHWLASSTSQSVLERGGNAIDAAVAGAFVLHLVEPHLNGPGGDLTAIIALASDTSDATDATETPEATDATANSDATDATNTARTTGTTGTTVTPATTAATDTTHTTGLPRVLSGQGAAPAAATIEHYRSLGLDEVPGAGPLAAAVPGSVVAWLTLLADHGTWALADVLAPAIGYARDGHHVHANVVRTLHTVSELFEKHWTTSADHWMPDGHLPEAGDLIRNETWAGVLDRLVAASELATAAENPATRDAARAAASENASAPTSRADGIRAAIDLWNTDIADAMERFAALPARHSTGGDHAGVLTRADVAAFEPRWEEPIELEFRGTTIAKAGAWTQGPVLLQTLAILDAVAGDDLSRLDPSTEIGVHTIAEALKLALADRDAWYADVATSDARDSGGTGDQSHAGSLDRDAPDTDPYRVPLATLLSPAYAAERAALISETASHEIRPGRPDGRDPWMPPLLDSSVPPVDGLGGTGEPTVRADGRTRGDTCHLDVVDRWGNLVSATPSGGWLQSSPTIPELGFCLGTRLQMTWLDAASPSALTPGVRPRSTLSPTMLVQGGEVIEALGTPGGDQQDQWQLLYLLRRIVGGWSPQAAIDGPMFHATSHVASFQPRTWTPGGLVVESRLGDDVIHGLRTRGHHVTVSGPWTLGRLSAVGIDRKRGGFYAAANPRGGQGYAVGR